MNERRKGRDKPSEENGRRVENFFFPLIGEKARGLDKKDEPNQTTGDRTQGKKKAEIESDREQETGKGRWGLRQQGKAGECRKR